MEFEPAEYVRKSFNVKAAEVAYENIEAIATWCKGTVETESTKILGGNEVKLPVIKFAGQGEDRGKELVARLGSFVVYSKGRFRVYKAPQFHAAFRELKLEQVAGQPYDPEIDDEYALSDEKVVNATQTLLDAGMLKLQDSPDNSSIDGQETVHVSL